MDIERLQDIYWKSYHLHPFTRFETDMENGYHLQVRWTLQFWFFFTTSKFKTFHVSSHPLNVIAISCHFNMFYFTVHSRFVVLWADGTVKSTSNSKTSTKYHMFKHKMIAPYLFQSQKKIKCSTVQTVIGPSKIPPKGPGTPAGTRMQDPASRASTESRRCRSLPAGGPRWPELFCPIQQENVQKMAWWTCLRLQEEISWCRPSKMTSQSLTPSFAKVQRLDLCRVHVDALLQ